MSDDKAFSDDPEILEMMTMLMEWHQHRVKQMHQILEASEDTNFAVQGPNGETITLEGDILKGFKAGISIAEELFTPFPVKVSIDAEQQESSKQ